MHPMGASQAKAAVTTCWASFEKWLRALVSHVWFDYVILSLTIANAVTLALDAPDADPQMIAVLQEFEFWFLVVFTAEMVLKLVAFRLQYFRDGWNVMDAVIVGLGWLTTALTNTPQVSAFRVLRAFRVFRVLKSVSKVGGLKTLVNSVLRALPQLGHVLMVVLFFIIVAGAAGVQLFRGVADRRCYQQTTNTTFWELDVYQKQRCTPQGGVFHGRPCDAGTTCWEPTTFPAGGCPPDNLDCVYREPLFHWNNVFSSMLVTLKILAMDDWPFELFKVQSGWTQMGCIYFLGIVILGSFLTVQLALAVMAREFLNASAKERNAKQEVFITKVRSKSVSVMPTSDGPFAWRRTLIQVVASKWFRRFFLSITTINVVVLATDYYSAPFALKETIRIVNLVCSIIFALEAFLKMLAFGIKGYFFTADLEGPQGLAARAGGSNWMDFILVALSMVEFFLSDSSSLSVFRAFRLTRVIRVAHRWPRLHRITYAMIESFKDSVFLFFLLLMFMFIFTVLGMQLFGDSVTVWRPVRFSFRTLWLSGYTVFITVSGVQWTTIMDLTVRATSWLSVGYFLSLFLFGHYVLINLFTCILIDSLRHYSSSASTSEALAASDVHATPVITVRPDSRLCLSDTGIAPQPAMPPTITVVRAADGHPDDPPPMWDATPPPPGAVPQYA